MSSCSFTKSSVSITSYLCLLTSDLCFLLCIFRVTDSLGVVYLPSLSLVFVGGSEGPVPESYCNVRREHGDTELHYTSTSRTESWTVDLFSGVNRLQERHLAQYDQMCTVESMRSDVGTDVVPQC